MKIIRSLYFRRSIGFILCFLLVITFTAPVKSEADDKPSVHKGATKSDDKDESLRKKELDELLGADRILSNIMKAGEQMKAIQENGNSCANVECPTLNCDQASQLRQSLLDTDTALDEMYRRLMAAEAAAAQNYNNLQANNHLTGTIYRQVQDSLALQKYLHKIGTIMLKIANIKETLDKMMSGEYGNYDKMIEKLDGIANSLKNTLDILEEADMSPVGDPAKLGITPESQEAVKHIWNIKSTLKDAMTVVRNYPKAVDKNTGQNIKEKVKIAKAQEKALLDIRRGALKLVSKALVTWSDYQIKVSKQILDDMKNYDNAEVTRLVEAYLEWQKLRARRDAAEDALAAVRSARDGHEACLNKTKCGNTSVSRPPLPAYKGYTKEAMNALDKLLSSGTASIEKTGGKVAIKDDCSAPKKDWKSSVPSKHAVKAKCPSCDWRAKELERLLDERQFCVDERRRIEADLEKADELEKEAEIEREAVQKYTEFILHIRDARGNALERFMTWYANWARRNTYVRLDFEPSTEITIEELERDKNSLLFRLRAAERQIEFLRQHKDKVKPLWDKLANLDREVQDKKYLLEVCEKHTCKNKEATGQKAAQPVKSTEAETRSAPMPRKGGLVGGVESVGDAIRGK